MQNLASTIGSADLMPLITVTMRLILNLDTPRHFTFFIVYFTGFTYKIEFLNFSVSLWPQPTVCHDIGGSINGHARCFLICHVHMRYTDEVENLDISSHTTVV
jgi:hypothetical protein